ncbi:MAG TPA: caspase family protein [Pyrinomonadaceae bacterium]|jgi:uncharacterized caspase-like protein|nr:caspase family protein [Pyrinomonadaceae bacterium]
MGSEEILDKFYDGPCHALVIGISEYPQPPAAKEGEHFTPLKHAAKDAEDFANFLLSNGVITYNVKALRNSEASRENIYTELAGLAERCANGAANPLVIVFFSGHGCASLDGTRNYLVPHDARRDRLPATAIRNDEFSRMLAEVPTDRMVVFIDACNSGDIGMEGAKGAEAAAVLYSHEGLGEGAGRYFFASCSPKEQSYEDVDNGIFTGNLLLLLKGETDDIPSEEINTSNLIDPLSERVKKRALEKYDRNQTVTHSVREGQGILLAINKRVRAARIQKSFEVIESKKKFLAALERGILTSDSKTKRMLYQKLLRYVTDAHRDRGCDSLYELFDENFGLWEQGVRSLEEWVEYLLKEHERIQTAPLPPPSDVQAQEPAKGGDAFVLSAGQNVLTANKATSTPVAPQPAGTEEQRQISLDDQAYILKDIIGRAAYYSDAKPLIDVLTKPVVESVFVMRIHQARLKKKDDEALSSILDVIVERFQECWGRSAVLASATVSDVRFAKGNSE